MSLFRTIFDLDFIAALLTLSYIVGRLVQIHREGQLREVLGVPEIRITFSSPVASSSSMAPSAALREGASFLRNPD